jgi:hypothetical protein
LDGAGRGNGRSSWSVLLLNDYLFTVVVVLGTGVGVLVRVVVTVRVDGVLDTVGDLVSGVGDSLTKRVVLALVVVISHITLEVLGGSGSGTSRCFYSNLRWLVGGNRLDVLAAGEGVVLGGVSLLGVACTGDDRTGTFANLTFSNVDLGWSVVGGRAVDCIEVSIVGPVLNLDVGVGWCRRLGVRLVAVVGSLKLYAVSTLNVLRVRLGLRCSGLSVASLLVDM